MVNMKYVGWAICIVAGTIYLILNFLSNSDLLLIIYNIWIAASVICITRND